MTIERPMFPPVDPTRRRSLTVVAGGDAVEALPTSRAAAPATTEHESTRARAEYYSDLEQPMRELAVMTTVLATICQSPPIMPPGIKHEDLVDFLIGHLDLMVQDIFGNHRERLEETAVQS